MRKREEKVPKNSTSNCTQAFFSNLDILLVLVEYLSDQDLLAFLLVKLPPMIKLIFSRQIKHVTLF